MAWLAPTVDAVAQAYYGRGADGLKTIAGNNLYSPDGLARGLVHFLTRAAKAGG